MDRSTDRSVERNVDPDESEESIPSIESRSPQMRRPPIGMEKRAMRGMPGDDYYPSSDFRVGVGDVIAVSVLGVPELGKTVEISSTGKITLPYLGEVAVDGLTVFELEQKLTKLFDVAIVRDPQVSVLIRDYQSQSITVIGEVHRPGTLQIRGKLSLINALSMAGWITNKAGDTIRIQQMPKGAPADGVIPVALNPAPKSIEVRTKSLITAGDAVSNIEVNNGDIITVSKKDEDKFFYLLGGVNRPGAYNAEKEVHLLEAAAFAGGLSPTAKPKEVLIIRFNTQGERTEINANIDAILKGKAMNLPIQENDIVFIPTSGTKNVREELLNGLVTYSPISFIQSLAFSLFRR